MSVLPSPSKSNGASSVGTTVKEPPPQKPLISVKVAPDDALPASDCPIVPSILSVPPDARPPPPAMTDFVIENVPPDWATEIELRHRIERQNIAKRICSP